MDELEELDGIPAGKQCYVLTQNDCDGERMICTTVMVMTEVFCAPEELGEHMVLDKPGRADVSRFFAELSGKIVRAMDGGKREG